MLLDKDKAIVAVIDVQARLLSGVHEHETLVKNCSWLVRLAGLMDVPVIGSEQYPDGLGHTEESLRELVGPDRIYGKTFFACIDDPDFEQAFQAHGRKQVVLCGMESQACVLQSTLRLLEKGMEVYVVADAVSARNPFDTEVALRRMEQAGARIVTREMVGFEWLRRSDAAEFKAFSKEFLR
ncbi:hydrolase [Marinobacter halophilus]|uniref:Hydrolase n=1 Tax=Marinobacter halophilus TaxID=1323740 RepID=A0A2T1KJL6_9GAMM|nr:hydrolase [Marinobacter halophilus]PSF10265.1 hydrolase [Marinobacter halophilus]GGC69141.1 hydrolase [Marinobacter halophilus]